MRAVRIALLLLPLAGLACGESSGADVDAAADGASPGVDGAAVGCIEGADCQDELPGSSCIDGMCGYRYHARGTITLYGPLREGTLRILGYPESSWDDTYGPACDGRSGTEIVSIASPVFPQPYEVGIPSVGSFVMYAFIDFGNDDGETLRADSNDLFGYRRFSVTLGEVSSMNGDGTVTDVVDVGLNFDVPADPCP